MTYTLMALVVVAYAWQGLSGGALTSAWVLNPTVVGVEPWRLGEGALPRAVLRGGARRVDGRALAVRPRDRHRRRQHRVHRGIPPAELGARRLGAIFRLLGAYLTLRAQSGST
ncbi:MAG: hypothetical protein WBL06_07125 [Pseudolysinimonas sp.]|uniref:hypothetical protein n=1 Tax=Pseudolysinimonas sp. TaxID=2680009 RepID=UPI003C73C70A